MLTRKQHDLLVMIEERLRSTGVSPSFDEMKEGLGLKSKSGVHRLINALVERGFIRRLPNRARALEVIRMPEDATPRGAKPALVHDRDAAIDQPGTNVVRMPVAQRKTARTASAEGVSDIPLHGRIAAGTPIEALERPDSHLSVPPFMLGAGEHYALEVDGDSMIDAGIHDGDYVVIQKCDTARDGEIVVALVDQAEATLKRLKRQDKQIKLEPANSTLRPKLYEPHRVRVQGRLVGLIRRY
jgi:repressor LexA